MNDPGLDEPIQDADQIVKERVKEPHDSQNGKRNGSNSNNSHGDDMEDEEEEERNYLAPARWWYASTGIPLVAGTFGPMANAFSICALVENWRVRIPPGGTEEHGIDIRDPGWLIGVNAVSLAFALIANISLLLNMARRVPFKIAQPITIIGFWVASVLLIALIAFASSDFRAAGVQHQALTQAYYYAIFAAGLYQIISYLMCVTVYGAYRGHYSKEFKLTVAQRTLMLQTISFLVYLLLGALVYSHIEGWKFLDAVYWADFTSLTIGIGADYVPKTHLGRGLLFPFAMGGIIILGLVVGSIRSLILDRGKKKMAARLTEKTRARLVKEVEKIGNEKRLLRHKALMGLEKSTVKALSVDPDDGKIAELDRRQAEFEAMRRVQEVAATQRKYMSLGISTFAFAFLWTIGALIFFKAERNQQWSYFESLYFSYTTLLTIGYGDFEPMSNSGKPFFVFWSLLAVPTLTILISDMGDTVVKAIKDATIWLGEVTVLPSDEYSMTTRLKHGVKRATLGRVDIRTLKSRDIEQNSEGDDESQYQEMHPGLTRIFRNGLRRPNKGDPRTEDRLAEDFEESEAIDETNARRRGERWEEDEHHYRHMLISQIRKVYADVSAATPKKYTYDEWAYFLRLLGEDEHDASYHKSAPALAADDAETVEENDTQGVSPATHRHREFQGSVQEGAEAPQRNMRDNDNETSDRKSRATKWSWVGNRSPLMGDKNEAEWLLEKFFQRLEESLKSELKKKAEDGGVRNEATEHLQRDQQGTKGENSKEKDRSSERTVTRDR